MKNNEVYIFLPDNFNKALSEYTKVRIQNLYQRKKNLNKMRDRRDAGDSCIYAWTTDPKKQSELTNIEKLLVDMATDAYQTQNKIITELCSLVNLKTLDPETQKYLRLSPSLWPLIMGESDDLGHQDQAIFEKQDVDLYERNIVKNLNVEIRRESVICPLFVNKPVKQVVKERIRLVAPIDQKDNIKQTNKSSVKSKKKKKKNADSVHVASNTLIIENNEDRETESDEGEETNDNQQENLSTKTSDKQESKDANEDDTSTIVLEYVKPTSIPELDTNNDVNEDFDLSAYDAKADHKAHMTRKSNFIKTEDKESVTNDGKINGSNNTTYDKIYSGIFSPVSYSDFKTLWEHLGGSIKSSGGGGSHRKLIYNEKVIGGTFQPHGTSNYGPRCLKRLRQALEEITAKR